MVAVELHENVLTEHGHGEWHVVASLEADGSEYRLRDPENRFDLSLAVLSASTPGRRLLIAEDPEEWARSLASAYHAPDLYAVITHDDNPPEAVEVDRREVHLPDAAAPALYA